MYTSLAYAFACPIPCTSFSPNPDREEDEFAVVGDPTVVAVVEDENECELFVTTYDKPSFDMLRLRVRAFSPLFKLSSPLLIRSLSIARSPSHSSDVPFELVLLLLLLLLLTLL